MNTRLSLGADRGFRAGETVAAGPRDGRPGERWGDREVDISSMVNGWIDMIAPCPWSAHMGLHATQAAHAARHDHLVKQPLYTPEERVRRDATGWTLVQGILAPLQFLVFAISLGLVIRYLTTGEGYGLATASILLKTVLLYTIMITGSIWEKVVFGKWLFARSFFWEDVFSMLVLTLQTAYVASLLFGWGSPREQMTIAIAAYAVYVINAAQFVLKLREARLEAPARDLDFGGRLGGAA
jgi:3-vinyl bacteriochlorophyllide hydratase